MKPKTLITATVAAAALALSGLSTIPHAITYDLNGGTANNLPERASFWQRVELPGATKMHEIFSGWTDADGESRSELSFITGDIALRANYLPEYYAVQLTNDAGEVIATTMRKYGQVTDIMAVDVNSLIAEHPYENLVGWSNNGSEAITTITSESASNVTLTPVFEPKQYSITYELNGGTNADNPASYRWNTGVDSFADPSREGYTFTGWYSDADCSTPISSISHDTHEDVTLYAGWEAVQAPVTPAYTGSAGYVPAVGGSAWTPSPAGVVDPNNYIYIPAIGYKMSFQRDHVADSPVLGMLYDAHIGYEVVDTGEDDLSVVDYGSILAYGDHNSDGLGPICTLAVGSPVYLTMNGVTSVYHVSEKYECDGQFGEGDNSRPRGYNATFSELGIMQRNSLLVRCCTYDNTGNYVVFCR